MGRLGATAFALAATVAPWTPLQAAKADFERCDSLRAPGGKGDGMAAPASSFGFFSGATGTQGDIAACTAALADPRLLPQQNVRRAHLLRARAIARLAAGDPDGALADIDAAASATQALMPDPLFARSMGVSFTLARAAIWQAKGDRAKAASLAQAASGARPYAVSVQAVAAAILQQSGDPAADGASPYQSLLPLVPEALKQQFAAEVEAGHFEKAAKLYSRFSNDFPASAGTNVFLPDIRALVFAVVTDTGAAYSYAATGKAERARSILADARRKIDAGLRAIPGKDGVLPPPNPLAEPLNTLLSQWTTLTNARIAVAEKRPMDALNALVGNAVPVHAAGLDLLTSLRAALPEAQRDLAPKPDGLAARLAEQRKARQLDVQALRKAFPVPETGETLSKYKQSRRSILNGFIAAGYVPDGFRSKTDAASGITTVEYTGQSTSSPVVEEMTLLHAADLARQQGKRGLLIVARRDYSRMLNTTRGYGAIPVSSRPAGFKAELDVRFVDPASLPAGLEAERDRILDAERVYADLSRIYIPPADTGAP